MPKITLSRVGGASAILATLFLLPWFAFPKVAPLIGIEFPASLELEQWARFKVEHHSVVATIDWLVIVTLICEMAAAIAFFYVLRNVGALTWRGLEADSLEWLSKTLERCGLDLRRSYTRDPQAGTDSRKNL